MPNIMADSCSLLSNTGGTWLVSPQTQLHEAQIRNLLAGWLLCKEVTLQCPIKAKEKRTLARTINIQINT